MRSPLLAIFLVVLVDILGLTILLPLLPFYAEHFGASPFVVGLLVSTYALCQLVAGPVLGQISDHVGRKPVRPTAPAGAQAEIRLFPVPLVEYVGIQTSYRAKTVATHIQTEPDPDRNLDTLPRMQGPCELVQRLASCRVDRPP